MKRKIRDIIVWLLMFCKRLLRRPGFIVLLILIPVSAVAFRLGISDDTGVLRIGLYSNGSEIGDEIVQKLTLRDGIISFVEFDSEASARKAVIEEKIQGAWIFPSDLEERINRNAANGTTEPLVGVIEKDETVPLKLSHEILYGSLHPYVAYSNYESFTSQLFSGKADTSKEALQYFYENGRNSGDIITIKILGEEERETINTNVLTYPLRGLLAIISSLCGLASVMLFINDRALGKFDRLPRTKHIIPAFGSCFAGVIMSSVTVVLSVYLLGLQRNFASEAVSILMFVLCTCLFCLICGMLFGKKLGVLTPFIMIVMSVQSPVFLSTEAMLPLRFLFPVSFYLYAVYDSNYIGYMAIYAVCACGILLVLNFSGTVRDFFIRAGKAH